MRREWFFRVFFYIMGLLVLALGITLNTKTNMGVSPLISVAFCVASLLEENVGDVTLIWYIVFVAVEIICHIGLKRYRTIPADILQIPLSIVFTRFMNLFSDVIPDMTGSVVTRGIFLVIAIVLTGVGIGLTLNVRLIPNPGDGIVQALSDCCGRKVSTVKNMLDAFCVLITVVISMIFAGKLIGIGVGTILAVIFVGRAVAVFNYFCKDAVSKLSGLKA
ncbi:MAG: hypothetical protein HDR02_06840 [Lachnospiraceae bacterium]|nr:hypothetical protein [Lachnospiraceae bacterium]